MGDGSTWDIFLGVGEVHVQSVLAPDDALVLVGLGVGETSSLSSLSAPDSVEVWSLLVFPSSLNSVTLGTGLREDLLSVVSAHDYVGISWCSRSESCKVLGSNMGGQVLALPDRT